MKYLSLLAVVCSLVSMTALAEDPVLGRNQVQIDVVLKNFPAGAAIPYASLQGWDRNILCWDNGTTDFGLPTWESKRGYRSLSMSVSEEGTTRLTGKSNGGFCRYDFNELLTTIYVGNEFLLNLQAYIFEPEDGKEAGSSEHFTTCSKGWGGTYHCDNSLERATAQFTFLKAKNGSVKATVTIELKDEKDGEI